MKLKAVEIKRSMYVTSENLQIMENCCVFREAAYRVIANLKGICMFCEERERERERELFMVQPIIFYLFLGI